MTYYRAHPLAQVILTGDFFQLPPVGKGKETKFAFESEKWSTVIKHTIMLTKVFRQADERTDAKSFWVSCMVLTILQSLPAC